MPKLKIADIYRHLEYENFRTALRECIDGCENSQSLIETEEYKKIVRAIAEKTGNAELFYFNATEKKYIETISGGKIKENKYHAHPDIYSVIIDSARKCGFLKKIKIQHCDKTAFNGLREQIEKMILLVSSEFNELLDTDKIQADFVNRFDETVFDYADNIGGQSYQLSLYLKILSFFCGSDFIKQYIVATGCIDNNGNITAINDINIKLECIKNELPENCIALVPLENKKDIDANYLNELNIKFIDNIRNIPKVLNCKLKLNDTAVGIGCYDYFNQIDSKYYKYNRNFNLSTIGFFNLYRRLNTAEYSGLKEYRSLYYKTLTKLALNALHKIDAQKAEEYLQLVDEREMLKCEMFDELVEFNNSRAIYLMDNLEFGEAVKLLEKIYAADYFNSVGKEWRLNFYNTIGQAYMYFNRHKDAEKFYNKTLNSATADRMSRTLNYRAKNYIYWRKYAAAEKDLKKSLDFNKLEKAEINNDCFAYIELAKLKYLTGDYDKAVFYADCVLFERQSAQTKYNKKAPSFLLILGHKYKGLALLKNGKLGKALKELVDLITIRIDDFNSIEFLIKLTAFIEFHLFDDVMFDSGELNELINNSRLIRNILPYKEEYNKNDLRLILKKIKY